MLDWVHRMCVLAQWQHGRQIVLGGDSMISGVGVVDPWVHGEPC
jgi:hypothetical protein